MRKSARQGSKLAGKGAYLDVSDRRLQVQLTLESKIASDFSLVRAIFAFAGFVSALGAQKKILCPLSIAQTQPARQDSATKAADKFPGTEKFCWANSLRISADAEKFCRASG